MSIQCWPYGHNTRKGDCDAEVPDDSFDTMKRFGWGFTQARDDGAASGSGPFMACPEHRGDCDEEGRERARQKNAAAKAASTGGGE